MTHIAVMEEIAETHGSNDDAHTKLNRKIMEYLNPNGNKFTMEEWNLAQAVLEGGLGCCTYCLRFWRR